SKYSKVVVAQARHWAKELGAELVYAHVFEDPIVHNWQRHLWSGEVVQHYEKEIRRFYRLKSEKLILRRGKAYQQRIKVADGYENLLIIVGHRGHSSITSQFFLGSTAEKLSIKSPDPVLIYRGKNLVDPQRVLIPTDLSEGAGQTLKG